LHFRLILLRSFHTALPAAALSFVEVVSVQRGTLHAHNLNGKLCEACSAEQLSKKSTDNDRGSHKWMKITMVGKGTFFPKGEAKGATRINRATVECRPIITGSSMWCLGGISPGHGRANSNV
jgi:hypothetical protein